MTQQNRREVFRTASSLLVVSDLFATQRARGSANDRIQVAVMGMGGRGGELMTFSTRIKGVEVVALCDPDVTKCAPWATTLETTTNKSLSLSRISPRTRRQRTSMLL